MGCGSSFSILPTIGNENSANKSPRLPPITSSDKRLDNLEAVTLVSLDNTIDENDQDFRSIIDYLRCFNDLQECEEFLRNQNKTHDLLFFIVSNTYATNIISHIHDLTQIISIYIFEQKTSDDQRTDLIDEKWTKRYPKVRGIYLDRQTLLTELSSDVQIHQKIADLLPLTVYSRLDNLQTNNSSTDHLRFLFYQLFLHQYCLNSSSFSKSDLLDLAEDYYHSNTHQLNELTELNEKYHSAKNVFQWFFRECCLRRLLSKSLLTLNLRVLFALRFFIQDMHKGMLDSTRKYQSSEEQIFYRSQLLSSEIFGRIKSNIGKNEDLKLFSPIDFVYSGELLSINDFFIVNDNRHDSLADLRQYISSTNLIYRILFEINIPSNYQLKKQRPLIDVTYFTAEKNTILFFIGSIFRIDTVVFDMLNDCWIIQMSLYDEQINEDFSQLFQFLHHRNSSMILANLLRQISPESAEEFYRHLLKENSKSISTLECYRGLGLCSYSRENYEQALIFFDKALKMESNNQLIKSSLHNSIGLVYAQQDEVDQAHIHFFEALQHSSSPLHSACAHHNLALISSRKGLHDEELDHYQEAFQIRTDQLPSNHLQMASLLNNIGVAHSEMHQYDQALSNLKKALEMRLRLLSDTHIDVARNYANIGAVYSQTQEFHMAFEYLTKAQLLFEKQTIIPEEDIKQLHENMKIVNDKLRRKTR